MTTIARSFDVAAIPTTSPCHKSAVRQSAEISRGPKLNAQIARDGLPFNLQLRRTSTTIGLNVTKLEVVESAESGTILHKSNP